MKLELKKLNKRADSLDAADKLKSYRDQFIKDSEPLIYLDGNSLGKLPVAAKVATDNVIEHEWGKKLIRSWNDSWWEMPERASKKISKLIGANENEVIVCDSTSVNLYKLAMAALKARKGRSKIISEETNFPTDLYVLQGVIKEMDKGHQLELAKSHDGIDICFEEFERLIDIDTALVVLTYVSFKSSSMHDMKRINELAHSFGALVIWDLCHAVGAVPVDLNSAGADMAVGCTYKYLNCGPGSPAFLYIRKELQKKISSPVWGWFGEKNPFEFSLEYRPSDSVKQFMTGTPGILSMCTIEPSLELMLSAGIDNLREKSVKMTELFIEMYHSFLEPHGFTLGSPDDPRTRGSHISLKHNEAYRIARALLDQEIGDYTVVPDFRPPDNLRFGFAPLYNTFSEVYLCIVEILNIMENKSYLKYSLQREDVT